MDDDKFFKWFGAAWIFGVIFTVAFWVAVIVLGFYAVNQFTK